ncbi:hypothetical protein AL465_000580, partial [Bordetella pertussis 18323]
MLRGAMAAPRGDSQIPRNRHGRVQQRRHVAAAGGVIAVGTQRNIEDLVIGQLLYLRGDLLAA